MKIIKLPNGTIVNLSKVLFIENDGRFINVFFEDRKLILKEDDAKYLLDTIEFIMASQ